MNNLCLLIGLCACLLFTACSQENKEQSSNKIEQQVEKKQTANKDDPSLKPVGGDKDENGCLIGAGFQWSELRQECIQVFNTGKQVQTQFESDPRFAFYIVSSEKSKDMELFAPEEKKPILLKVVGEGATWESDDQKWNLAKKGGALLLSKK